jgi:hypothetical protein
MRFRVILFLMICFASFVVAQQPQTQTAPLSAINAKYTNGVAPGYRATAGSGLTLNLSAGTAFCGGVAIQYAGGTLTMTASTTNYVYLNPAASCAPAFNTTGFASTVIPLAAVVTGSSSITSIADDRTMFVPPGSGGGAVPSVNGISTAVTIAAGSGATVNTTGSTITIGASGGGGGGSALPESTVSQGGGANFFGNSTSYAGADAVGCTSPDTDCNEVGRLVVAAYGGMGAAYPRAIPGYTDGTYGDSTILDVLDMQILPYTDPGDSGAPDTFIQGSTTDAALLSGCGFCIGTVATITNGPATHNAALTAAIAWTGTPHFARIYATNSVACTTTGTWSADNSFHSGVALETISPGATISCVTPYPISNALIAAWHVFSGGTATATFAIDGTTVDTWNSGAGGTISTRPGSTSLWWGARYPVSSTPATHTLLVTVTAAGSGNPFSVAFFASPEPKQNWLGMVWPHVFVGGVPYEQSDGGEPYTGQFDAYIQSITSQLNVDGWKVKFVDLRDAWPDSTTIFTGGTYLNGRVCAASTVSNPHPGTCGHLFWAWAYLKAAGKRPHYQVADSFNGRTGDIVPQSGDYTASQVTNAAATNADNTFAGGTQIFQAPSTIGVASEDIGAPATISASFVQMVGESRSATVAGVFPSPVTIGNTIFVLADGSSAPSAPTDSLGNTYSLISTLDYTPGCLGWNIYLFAAQVTNGGSDTISGFSSGGSGYGVNKAAFEYSGLGGTPTLDGSPTYFDSWNGSSCFGMDHSQSVPTFTPSGSDLLISVVMAYGALSNPVTISSPWTERIGSNWTGTGLTGNSGAVAFADISTTSLPTGATWSGDSGDGDFAIIYGFKLVLPAQTGDLHQNKLSSGVTISGVHGSGLPFVVPQYFSDLAACPSLTNPEGTWVNVRDGVASAWGDSVTAGGGSYHGPLYCDGTSWVVR